MPIAMTGRVATGVVGGLAVLLVANATLAIETWRVSETDREGQLTIYNRTAQGALLGLPVALGDVDGDGLADAVLTPMNADSGPGRARDSAGEIGVVLSSGTLGGEFDLATLDPDDLPESVTLIFGRDAGDLLGTETGVADVDGDGFADIIAGAQNGDGPNDTRPGSGEVVIIWGRANYGGRVIDTSQPSSDVSIIYGADIDDRLGVWVFFGDLDGDGTQDVVMGADQGNGPNNERNHVGESYVLYGGAHLRAFGEIDLADTDLPLTVVYGIDDEDHSGCTVRAGDLNSDGTDELLIGAGLNRLSASIGNTAPGHGSRGADGPDGARFAAGEAYALYLGPGTRPPSIDLRSPPPSTVFIYGADNGDAYGEELFVGDFNGDGYGDIAIGAIVGDSIGNSRVNAGELALVLGGADLPGSAIDLRFPPSRVTMFYGQAMNAIAGDTAMFDDLDGDGLDDLIIASPNAPVGNVVRAGVTHIFFGTAEPLPAVVDLAAVPEALSALLIEGASFNDMLAYSMSSGDADGDDIADLMLNVMDGDGFGDSLPSSGDAHVLSGVALSRAAGRLPGNETPTPAATPTATSSPTPTASPTPTLDGCSGDCDGDLRVTVSELITGVRIALGMAGTAACPAMDGDGNGIVTIAELVQGVRAALEGCSRF
jgi:hypothetical protein